MPLSPTKMLINSTLELKEYIPAGVSLDFNDIRPKIRLVEREIIQRIFSNALYEAVIDSGASDEILKLKEILAESVAHLALLEYIPFGQLQFDSGGIRIASNDQMKTAFQWQIDALKEECSRQGWAAIEASLEFLEKTQDAELIAIWQQTDTYTESLGTLIKSLRVFERFVNLNHSRVLFHKLLPIMNDRQEEVIVPAIGQELFTRLLTDMEPVALKAKKLAAKSLAYATMAMGFMDTMLVLSDNGPMIIDGIGSRASDAKKTAPTDLVKIIAENYNSRAESALRELVEYCQKNVATLSEYTSSDNYISDEDQTDHIARNDPEWGIAFF